LKCFYYADCGAGVAGVAGFVDDAAAFTVADVAAAAINAVLLTVEPTAESGSAFRYVTTAFIKVVFEATYAASFKIVVVPGNFAVV
jgi:hypothetical protein